MSESDATDDIDAIRERKKAELEQRAGSPSEPIHVSGQSHFEELLASHPLILVDFHAEWCGPCQMLSPVMDDIAQSTPATVLKVDVDENQALAQEHNVQGVPTVMLVEDGAIVERLVGMQPESLLRSLVDQHTTAD